LSVSMPCQHSAVPSLPWQCHTAPWIEARGSSPHSTAHLPKARPWTLLPEFKGKRAMGTCMRWTVLSQFHNHCNIGTYISASTMCLTKASSAIYLVQQLLFRAGMC
jgi:hypothetical protein